MSACKRLPQQTVPQSFCYCSNTPPRQWIRNCEEDAGNILIFTGPMRCRQVAKPTCTTSTCYFWCTFYMLPWSSMSRTSQAWCKAVKLNSAPHQFTSASAGGLENLYVPSKWGKLLEGNTNKTTNFIHLHMYSYCIYIYILFNHV